MNYLTGRSVQICAIEVIAVYEVRQVLPADLL